MAVLVCVGVPDDVLDGVAVFDVVLDPERV